MLFQFLADWHIGNTKYGHHFLVAHHLEHGYGTSKCRAGKMDRRSVNTQALNEIHSRQCTGLGTIPGDIVSILPVTYFAALSFLAAT